MHSVEREYHEDPEDTKTANATDAHEHGLEGVSHSAQRARHRIHQSAEDVSDKKHGYEPLCGLQNGHVLGIRFIEIEPDYALHKDQFKSRNHRAYCNNLDQTVFDGLLDSVDLESAVVLRRKGYRRLRKG